MDILSLEVFDCCIIFQFFDVKPIKVALLNMLVHGQNSRIGRIELFDSVCHPNGTLDGNLVPL